VERACAVLEHLATANEPCSATQVARALELERTAAHRLLRTLAQSGMVSTDGAGQYSIGPRALAVGMSYVEQLRVRRIALPYLMELSLEYTHRPWSIVLAVFDGTDILLVERLWNPRTPLDSLIAIGGKMPVDRTAAGWAYLAQLPDDEIRAIVGPPRFKEIATKIREARETGISFAQGELQPGIDALSAPIVDASGRPVAVVIVGGTDFSNELHPDSQMAGRVTRICARLSETLAVRR
jgi:IclR family transcriptional regulator, acetate operon repressor